MNLPLAMYAHPLSDTEIRRIMTTYGSQMKRVCTLYLADAHLAEDATQEAFIKIYKHHSSFRGACAEKTWIMRITVNVCRDMLRTGWLRHLDRSRTPEMLTIPVEAPGEEFAVLDSVMELPLKYREVILLRYYQEMALGDIAKTLCISRYTANQRLKTARDMLHRKLRGWYFDEPCTPCSGEVLTQ